MGDGIYIHTFRACYLGCHHTIWTNEGEASQDISLIYLSFKFKKKCQIYSHVSHVQFLGGEESILDSLLQLTDFDPASEFCFQSIMLVLEPLDLGTTYNEKGMNVKGQRNEEKKDNSLLFLVCLCKKKWTSLTKY